MDEDPWESLPDTTCYGTVRLEVDVVYDLRSDDLQSIADQLSRLVVDSEVGIIIRYVKSEPIVVGEKTQ